MSDSSDSNNGEFRGGSRRTGLITGERFGIKAVQYSAIDGVAMFEGDIVLGSVEELEAQTRALRDVMSGAAQSAAVISGSQFRWPNCRIPYDIDSALPNTQRVTDAIAHWEARTRFRFVLRTAANAASFPDYVTFRPGSGCSSSIGRRGGQQFINLGPSCSTGNAIHEIGHTVGLWHEQSREDRDAFVTIHWDKVTSGLEHNFDQHISDGDDVGAYDYGSIMHYPRNAFSIDGSDTITPVDSTANIGQRAALSPGDIAAANSFCPADAGLVVGRATLTRKETIKDVRLDTRKEFVSDTIKEQVRDTFKEVPRDTRKEGPLDPLRGGLGRFPLTQPLGPPTGAVPLAVATPHRASKEASSARDDALALDQQLLALAEALTLADTERAQLQQQYDALADAMQAALERAESDEESS